MKTLSTLAVLAGLSSLAVWGAEAPPFHWSGSVPAGKSIQIHGINGAIHADRAQSGTVEVTATRTSRMGDPNKVEIQVAQTADGVKICAVYPGSSKDCEGRSRNRESGWRDDVQVEFTVKVPAGVNFEGHTVNGSIDIAGIDGEAKAHTVNGKVSVTASTLVDAHTVNGSIKAVLTSAPSKPMNFHTVNGSVDLTMPAAASAKLTAHTVNGKMETDFPITLHGTISRRTINGTIGNAGGPEIQVHTVNGSVTLRKGA